MSFMSDITNVAQKKAELIHYGSIYVPDSIKLPYALSSSTAGPGAGKKTFALSFGGTRLKLGISKDEHSMFSLLKTEEGYTILKEGDVFLDDVEIIPTLLHAPNQAFVNLKDGCIYNCEFCATPKLTEDRKKNKDTKTVVNMILEASKEKDFQSVAITSGVVGSPEGTLHEIIDVIKEVREKLPNVQIGVEPYVTSREGLERLHDAGATEIKINIESFDREIFQKICPDLDYDELMNILAQAVSVFGKGKVTTNILIGLGETDENVLEGVEHFAKIGIVPVIRVLRINDTNYLNMINALGYDISKVPADRMIRLAKGQKEILKKYGLSPGTFETMCHKCGCCDIVPFRDI